jgi:hypothetical protein
VVINFIWSELSRYSARAKLFILSVTIAIVILLAMSGKHYLPYAGLLVVFAFWLSYFKWKDIKKMLPVLIILLIFSSMLFVDQWVPPETMVIYSGGRDELANVTFGRMVGIEPSWKTWIGEGVFYRQPLHRYIYAGLFLILGEGMWGPYTVQVVMMSLAGAIAIIYLRVKHSYFAALFFLIAWLAVHAVELIFIPYMAPLFIAKSPLHQAIGAPILMLAVVLTLYAWSSSRGKFFHVGLGSLFGLSMGVRTDYLPILILPIMYAGFHLFKYGWRSSLGKIALMFLAIAMFLSAIIIKNYLAEGIILLGTSSVTINQYPDFRVIVPYERTNTSALSLITTVVQAYAGNIFGLISVLMTNLRENFIKPIFAREILWWGTPILAFLGLIVATARNRAKIIVLVFSFIVLILPNLFFRLHIGSFEMLIHYDFILLMIASISISAILTAARQGYNRQNVVTVRTASHSK